MGNSRGYKGLIETPENYNLASYYNLLSLDPEARKQNIRSALKKGGVRMFNSKARWLDNNFSFIQDCGGIEVIQNILLNTKGRNSKIKIMRLFEGIGNKYGRNIFMDLCHQDFINSIAVDERLSDILECLNVDPKSTYLYNEEVLVQRSLSPAWGSSVLPLMSRSSVQKRSGFARCWARPSLRCGCCFPESLLFWSY
jgi:hypothetical protein